jgi:trans-aconitate methyltransferase
MSTEWIAEQYDTFQKDFQLQYGLDLLSKLEANTELTGKTILDLGCGNGELTLVLKNRVGSSGKIVAVDQDSGMLNSLRMKNGSENIEVHQSDIITWLQSTDQRYNIIYSNAVLHWLNSYEEFNEVLQQADRCLYPSGYLAFRFSLYENAKAAKAFLEEKLRDYTGDKGLTLRRSIFDFNRCLAYLDQAGFEVIVSEELSYDPFEDQAMSFEWMVKSQPLLAYLGKDELERFQQVLWQQWQQEQVGVRSHHGIFLVGAA